MEVEVWTAALKCPECAWPSRSMQPCSGDVEDVADAAGLAVAGAGAKLLVCWPEMRCHTKLPQSLL